VSQVRVIDILVVDDDDDDLYLINEALQEATGATYRSIAVTSPMAAMTELAKAQFDVILSDYRLGPLTGIDFIQNVRKAGIETPVVLLTGMPDSVVDKQALEAGASDFVPKHNISPDVLDRTIRYAMAHAERQRLLQAVLRSTHAGVAVVDDKGEITLSNPSFAELATVAYGEIDGKLKRFAHDMCNLTQKDTHVGDRVVEGQITPMKDGSRIVVLHDVTQRVHDLLEREHAERRVHAIAMQDGLTNLPNRMAFNAFLDRSITEASAAKSQLSVLIFDFNRFKEVNDFFGHAAGDYLLQTTASRLRALITENEYAARMGGDEFVMVQNGADVESATDLAKRLTDILCQPVFYEGKVIEPGISVGISFYPDHGQVREELLANADLAMYRAKSSETGDVCVFGASIDTYVRERRKTAFDLKDAITNDELELYYQPQFNASTQKLAGVEALIRWNHKTRGMVSPAEFITVAEENGLINEIDNWVMRRACETAAANPRMNRIAVNLSAKAMSQPNIAANIRQILLDTGLSASRLEVEITETALVQDLNRALHSLRQMKALGIAIAMDDFGTGYSSLSLLNSFPFDRIKIDKSFIQAAENNDRAGAIFKSVIGLGKALQVEILAEGVETEFQYSFARDAGCDDIQGYFFSKPLPSKVIEDICLLAETDVTVSCVRDANTRMNARKLSA
jgi:diguanylate cyclase (GGDEF)-like protein